MKSAILVFISPIILGVVGMIIDANVGFDGTLGTIISMATIGAFIVSAIEDKEDKEDKQNK